MGRRNAWALVAAFLIATGALPASGRALQVGEAKGNSLHPRGEFAEFDASRDGHVSFEEFTAQGGDGRAFREADADRDGRLSSDEFIKARSIDQRIKTGQYFADAWITARVKARLLKDNLLDNSNIRVETQDGVVRLSGEVKSTKQARHAIGLASAVAGVVSVRNGLLLR